MKLPRTIHEKNAARLTSVICLLLILLIFVAGPNYLDPPEEYGVLVNFGTTNFGSANIQPLEPIKSEALEVNSTPNEADVETTSKAITEETNSAETDHVLSQDNAESIVIKKSDQQKLKAENEAKNEAERLEKLKQEAETKKQQEQQEKKKRLDALMGGLNNSEGTATGSEGDDDKTGDKGQLDGNPYAASYFGEPGKGSSGVGYGLNGRGKATFETIKQNCNESGLVIVKIVVNQNGLVTDATAGVKGTTNTSECLLEPALKIAKSHKWQPDPNAPQQQIGFVRVNFNLGQ